MPRKPRSDSVAAALNAMVAASSPPPAVPGHVRLRETDHPFWDGIVRARTRDEWSAADLVVAAQLARCQYDIERESILLDDEGTVVVNDRGTQIANPRVSVLEQLARREMALLRTLRMGGAAAGGDKRDLDKARTIQRQSEALRQELADDLIAR